MKNEDKKWALYERPRATVGGKHFKWKRTFPDCDWDSSLSAARVYQSYLLTGIFPGEDGDLSKEYKVRRVR